MKMNGTSYVSTWQTLCPKFTRFIIEFHAGVRARIAACTSVSHAWRERTLGRTEGERTLSNCYFLPS